MFEGRKDLARGDASPDKRASMHKHSETVQFPIETVKQAAP